MNTKDFFAEKAKDYDNEESRTQNVSTIAQTILNEVVFSKEMSIMDFGSGTGLLLSEIAPYVGEITAVDVSSSMIEVLTSKKEAIKCPLEIVQMDLTTATLDLKFDAIISSMTMHHIKDTLAMFKIFYSLLKDNGTIAIADLDTEDGSFHTEDTGVFHCGFDRDEFVKIAKSVGFKDIKIQDASIASKPTGNYSVFLLTAKK
ncbi:MAG: class I SAM-dependent methyltransferase [Flavobacterium sp.]|uniref:class I SAM-dependent methyltransferase n=1 Tax=Flavobacterium sp. TaxID=239 RepID=UPI00261E1D66|nr:class I SAM-dependent methyltransferase [Flavobacterium sp.]MDD5150523.1 class I SAM-dependent methyltransferase [Flavobacterium sp.]